MLFDDVLRNPAVKKAIEAGEERVGRAVGRLLGGDGLHALLSSAAQARETLEKGVARALHAANLPSRDDVASLQRRLAELEAMIDGLAARVEPARTGAQEGAEARSPEDGGEDDGA